MAIKLTDDAKTALAADIENTNTFDGLAHFGSHNRLIPADAQPGYTTSGRLLTLTMREKKDRDGVVRTYKTGATMHDITAYMERDGETCALYLGDIETSNLNRASHRPCGVLPGDRITVTVGSLRHYTGRDGSDRTAPVLRFDVQGVDLRTDPAPVWDALKTAWSQSLDTTIYMSVSDLLMPVYGETVTADDLL